jgi:hypothetical protein
VTESTELSTGSGWDRRTVLKGAAAGTALWAVPSVTSLAGSAMAASAVCSQASSCGTVFFCDPTDTCVCAPTAEGTIACVNGFGTGQTCSASSDCGPGNVCGINDCSNPTGDCFALCGSTSSAKAQRNYYKKN